CFSVSLSNESESSFGVLQEGGAMAGSAYFECRVADVPEPNRQHRTGPSVCVFTVDYMVIPHPDGSEDKELAIPIKAVVVQERTDDKLDWSEKSHENSRLWASIGQMAGGVDGFFTGDAMSTIMSKLSQDVLGKDQSDVCYFANEVKKHTPCYIRIDEDAVY
ncbi:MAG: hypothetical protein WBD31_11505, partial [Rubripirellula sp.]